MIPRVLLISAVLVWIAAPGQAEKLFGLSQNTGGIVDIVNIDTGTGAATAFQQYSVDPDFANVTFTYHGGDQRFVGLFRDTGAGSAPVLVSFDPFSSATTTTPILTALGDGGTAVSIEGLEYQTSTGDLLLTIGETGTLSDRLAIVSLVTGALLPMSPPNLGLGDRDFVVENSASGDLYAIDFNNDAPRIAIIDDPFGSLSVTGISSPPPNGAVLDPAISPLTGEIFTLDGVNLIRVDTGSDSFVSIGAFGFGTPIRGLAFSPIPEPGTALLLGAGLVALAARRKTPLL